MKSLIFPLLLSIALLFSVSSFAAKPQTNEYNKKMAMPSTMTTNQMMEQMSQKMMGAGMKMMGRKLMMMGVRLRMMGLRLKATNTDKTTINQANKMISLGMQMFTMGMQIKGSQSMPKMMMGCPKCNMMQMMKKNGMSMMHGMQPKTTPASS
jgi:hypothetical protein